MISWRNYIAAVMLILVLMFLLMTSTVLRDQWNDYANNEFIGMQAEQTFEANLIWNNDAGRSAKGSAILIGNKTSAYGKAAEEWTAYTRRDFSSYFSLKACADNIDKGGKPEMLIIDSSAIDWNTNDDLQTLINYAEQGINLIFCTLPDVSVIKENKQVREFLGISEVAAEQKQAAGLYLYTGFLIGGEMIYLPPENPEESAIEQYIFPGDVNEEGKPVFNWYLPGPGTKVYMRGIPEDENVKSGEYPALIWRKSYGPSYVFAVNGGYMNGPQAIGILSAMAAEMKPYEIYPVVNARSLTLINYPTLADENRAEMQRIYSRSVKNVQEEIIWPDIFKVTQPYGYKITCMTSPQLDYSKDMDLDAERFDYYLKIFNESSAEVGLSLISESGIPAVQKAEKDALFFKDNSDYEFTSVYSGDIPDADVESALGTKFLSSVDTVVKSYNENRDIIDILSNGTVIQSAFDTDFNYTYAEDFIQRCIYTALGYSNISYDMSVITYPKTEYDSWDKMNAEFKTSIEGYGGITPAFDKTTISESGKRTMTFLTSQYKDSRDGNTIKLEIKGDNGTKWFILRTHNENISDITGGSFSKIEDGAYLITVTENEVSISLEAADNMTN